MSILTRFKYTGDVRKRKRGREEFGRSDKECYDQC